MTHWKLEDILLAAPILVFVIDPGESLVLIAGGLSQQLGLDLPQVLGKTAFRISNFPIKKAHFRKVLSGESFTITLSIHGASYETQLNPLRKNGLIEGVVGITVDVTKHLKLEEYLDEERHRLLAAQRLNSLAGIANGLAHEINNPLAIISGYAEQLATQSDKGSLTPERLNFTTKKLIEASNRCHSIIESLRTFARDGSKDPFEACPISALVDDALILCQEQFQASGVRLSWRKPALELLVDARRVQIVQVLFNLLTNACEAARASQQPLVSLECEDQESHIVLKVIDNGAGIPEAYRVRIFEPFFTTKVENRSVGVGLSTAKGIVEEHQGNLSFETQPGITCFMILLPKKQATLPEVG